MSTGKSELNSNPETQDTAASALVSIMAQRAVKSQDLAAKQARLLKILKTNAEPPGAGSNPTRSVGRKVE